MSGTEDAQAGRPEEGGARPPGCAAVEHDLAELALGVLTGRERVAALGHLESCAHCAADVEQLSALGDRVLDLAPVAEPPVGFEAGVFSRLGFSPDGVARRPRRAGLYLRGGAQGRPRRWPIVAAAGVAAAVLLGAGALAGHALSGPGTSRHSPLEAAALRTGGHDVGSVVVYPGDPTWLYMSVYDDAWQGPLRCEVTVGHGKPFTLGEFWLSDGWGAWEASTSVPAGHLSRALIVGQDGQVLASAQLS
jgi:hypothetical protein